MCPGILKPRCTVAGEQTLADGAAAAMPAPCDRASRSDRRRNDGASSRLQNRAAPWWCRSASIKSPTANSVGPTMSPALTSFEKSRNSFDAFDGDAVVLLDVAVQRLGQALFFLVVEAELDGIISILARLRLHLKHAVGADENADRDGNQHPPARCRRGCGRVFFLKVRVAWCLLKNQILMVMSTPAGKLSFFNSSTVLAVGSRMSISRLWVRCSKVSCDFLSRVR